MDSFHFSLHFRSHQKEMKKKTVALLLYKLIDQVVVMGIES